MVWLLSKSVKSRPTTILGMGWRSKLRSMWGKNVTFFEQANSMGNKNIMIFSFVLFFKYTRNFKKKVQVHVEHGDPHLLIG